MLIFSLQAAERSPNLFRLLRMQECGQPLTYSRIIEDPETLLPRLRVEEYGQRLTCLRAIEETDSIEKTEYGKELLAKCNFNLEEVAAHILRNDCQTDEFLLIKTLVKHKGEGALHNLCVELMRFKAVITPDCTDERQRADFQLKVHQILRRFFEKYGLDINCKMDPLNRGQIDTPLHMAVYAGDPDLARFLIQLGARKDILNVVGKTPYELTWLIPWFDQDDCEFLNPLTLFDGN